MKPTNKLMKRLSLYLFLILFSLQTPSQADDIRDFQIEGMSIGDSALDFFSKKMINEGKGFLYKSKKFYSVYFIATEIEFYDKYMEEAKKIISSIKTL